MVLRPARSGPGEQSGQIFLEQAKISAGDAVHHGSDGFCRPDGNAFLVHDVTFIDCFGDFKKSSSAVVFTIDDCPDSGGKAAVSRKQCIVEDKSSQAGPLKYG